METFVIRIWQAADSDGGTAPKRNVLRGIVEHVPSGRSARFRSGEELLSLVAARLASPGTTLQSGPMTASATMPPLPEPLPEPGGPPA
jgi:hypothetical protein